MWFPVQRHNYHVQTSIRDDYVPEVNLAVGKEKAKCWRNEVYAQERAHPLLPLGRLTNLLDTKFVWEDGTAVMQCRDKRKWRTMTKFEIRNNMAYASQMQFEVLRRALWVQQAHPDTVFNWQFWERAAHDPKMTSYLTHGVKAKMCETTPFVNSVGAQYVASRAQIEQACDSLRHASMSADVGVYDESPPNDSDARPTISLSKPLGQEMKRRQQLRDIAGATRRKPYTHRRQRNRWDQYGESSSAASSEAHITSDYVHSESTWGPYESAHRDQRTAQPYRLQEANRGEGQWSRWASDIRQSQPDYWSSSSKWQSSAGDDSSWKKVSDWEGSQWSAPTRRTLKGSEYETDQEW